MVNQPLKTHGVVVETMVKHPLKTHGVVVETMIKHSLKTHGIAAKVLMEMLIVGKSHVTMKIFAIIYASLWKRSHFTDVYVLMAIN